MAVSFLLPWLIVFPLQTGNSLLLFQTWTSSLFVSTSNFIIPVIIYFKCVQFRSQYNVDRQLSDKQIDLLTRIHARSTTLVKHLGRKRNEAEQTLQGLFNPVVNIIEPSFGVEAVHVVPPVIVEEASEAMTPQKLNLIINENVPDPDREDIDAGRLNPLQASFVSRLATSLARSATRVQQRNRNRSAESIEIGVISSQDLPRINIATPTIVESVPFPNVSNPNESQLTIKDNRGSNFSLLDVPALGVFEDSSDEENGEAARNARLARLKTLPTHPNFKSPAFRSVPKWMPIRGFHMAWIVLIVTSIVTFGNIIINLIPQ
jgi:hypothetical protein